MEIGICVHCKDEIFRELLLGEEIMGSWCHIHGNPKFGICFCDSTRKQVASPQSPGTAVTVAALMLKYQFELR